jgi:hypothetical protein
MIPPIGRAGKLLGLGALPIEGLLREPAVATNKLWFRRRRFSKRYFKHPRRRPCQPNKGAALVHHQPALRNAKVETCLVLVWRALELVRLPGESARAPLDGLKPRGVGQ